MGEQTLFRLRGLDQGLRGFEIDLLSPFEEVDVSVKQFSPENATPLNNWMVYHHAFLLEQHLGSNALQAVSPGRLVLEPYQLVPVMRALSRSRTRLLLCDDVGLGKTIQAGLVLVELIARRLAHRVLIVSPPGPLLEQWKAEMWDRFGLRVGNRPSEDGRHPANGTRVHSTTSARPPLWISAARPRSQGPRTDSFDVVVIDEAHHFFRTGVSSDRSDTQRRKLAEVWPLVRMLLCC